MTTKPPYNPIWRPYTQEMTAAPALKIQRAQGAYLFAENGQKIFDGISSWWVITHGHCHPQITEAIARQAAQVDQVLFANFTHAPAEELAARLIDLTPPNLTRIFFSDNGSTAVESGLKMVLQSWAQRGYPRKRKFIAFANAYHGDTVGSMSVSGRGLFTAPFRNLLFDVIHAAQPTHSQAPAADYVRDFRRQLEEHHAEIAGVILEPLVQGAGGMIVWPAEAVREVSALCKRWNVALILDEVMTGFGRTGTLFAADRVGVEPDILCLSKGISGGALPLAATLASEEIYGSFLAPEKSRLFFHGHSFTGNAISCAAAVANLTLFASENTLAHLEKIERVHRDRIESLSARVPLLDRRVCGTIAALEVDVAGAGYTSAFGENFARRCLREGVFLRPLGNIIYLLPTYASTVQDLNYVWDVVEASLI